MTATAYSWHAVSYTIQVSIWCLKFINRNRYNFVSHLVIIIIFFCITYSIYMHTSAPNILYIYTIYSQCNNKITSFRVDRPNVLRECVHTYHKIPINRSIGRTMCDGCACIFLSITHSVSILTRMRSLTYTHTHAYIRTTTIILK